MRMADLFFSPQKRPALAHRPYWVFRRTLSLERIFKTHFGSILPVGRVEKKRSIEIVFVEIELCRTRVGDTWIGGIARASGDTARGFGYRCSRGRAIGGGQGTVNFVGRRVGLRSACCLPHRRAEGSEFPT
jgi:hypothetical protein